MFAVAYKNDKDKKELLCYEGQFLIFNSSTKANDYVTNLIKTIKNDLDGNPTRQFLRVYRKYPSADKVRFYTNILNTIEIIPYKVEI